MANLNEMLNELRGEYVREADENLAGIATLIAGLEAGPDPAALASLHRRFLGLAGSGYTYGFPEVSRLGREGEKLCAALLGWVEPPSPSILSACESVRLRLRIEFNRIQAIYAQGPWSRPLATVSRSSQFLGRGKAS